MAKQIQIPITNGNGSKEIANNTYTVTAEVVGYDVDTIAPSEVTVEEGTESYAFTIAATGTLTLHVTDDGTDIGVPVEGATFYRCDVEGNTYGEIITTDADGNAVFANVPYAGENAPTIYYKQVDSDGEHDFDDTLQTTTLTEETQTVEVENAASETRQITLTDANYEGLPIEDGTITFEA